MISPDDGDVPELLNVAQERHARHLARSIRQIIETVEDLAAYRISTGSLTEAIDTTSPGGRNSSYARDEARASA